MEEETPHADGRALGLTTERATLTEVKASIYNEFAKAIRQHADAQRASHVACKTAAEAVSKHGLRVFEDFALMVRDFPLGAALVQQVAASAASKLEVVHKAWFDSFLVCNDDQITSPQCDRAEHCEAVLMGLDNPLPAFRLPSGATFTTCALCTRAETTRKWLTQAPLKQPYREIVGPGEYAHHAQIPRDGVAFMGISDTFVRHVRSRLCLDESRKCIKQVNVDFVEDPYPFFPFAHPGVRVAPDDPAVRVSVEGAEPYMNVLRRASSPAVAMRALRAFACSDLARCPDECASGPRALIQWAAGSLSGSPPELDNTAARFLAHKVLRCVGPCNAALTSVTMRGGVSHLSEFIRMYPALCRAAINDRHVAFVSSWDETEKLAKSKRRVAAGGVGAVSTPRTRLVAELTLLPEHWRSAHPAFKRPFAVCSSCMTLKSLVVRDAKKQKDQVFTNMSGPMNYDTCLTQNGVACFKKPAQSHRKRVERERATTTTTNACGAACAMVSLNGFALRLGNELMALCWSCATPTVWTPHATRGSYFSCGACDPPPPERVHCARCARLIPRETAPFTVFAVRANNHVLHFCSKCARAARTAANHRAVVNWRLFKSLL